VTAWGWLGGLAEDGTKVRPTRAEPAGGGEPQIDLQARWQQKRTVGGRGDGEVEVVQGGKLAVQVAAPVGHDRLELDVLGDTEEQVNVGPSVLAAGCRGAGDRRGGDPRIVVSTLKQLPLQPLPLLAGEHGWECTGRRDSASRATVWTWLIG
jgi:hypothetical protein